jgi:predicted Zn-ribbon and HTH transcriptional regulator
MNKKLELPKVKCKKCDHEWIKRVINPEKCPECGFRLEKENEAKVNE